MQLFNNLLESSLRYRRGGGLHISAEQRDKSLFLTRGFCTGRQR